jgi:hypothetical protein
LAIPRRAPRLARTALLLSHPINNACACENRRALGVGHNTVRLRNRTGSNEAFGGQHMRAIHLAVGTAAAALLLWGGAGQSKAGEIITLFEQPSVGVGMICNTSDQAQQYLDLRSRGIVAEDAMKRINDDAHDAHACGVAAIAFKRDKMLHAHTVENKLLEVVQINVLAGFDGTGWKPIPEMTQYAVMESQGEGI